MPAEARRLGGHFSFFRNWGNRNRPVSRAFVAHKIQRMKLHRHSALWSALLFSASLFGQTIEWSNKGNAQILDTYGAGFSADGKKVLTGSSCSPSAIRMFDAATGNLDWDLTLGSAFECIQGVKFSSNGSFFAAVEEQGNLLVFDNTGSVPVIKDTIDTGTSGAFSADISPANDKVAVGCTSGKLKIYNLSDGSLALSLTAHSGYVRSVSFAPNGNFFATGGSDKKMKIWSATGTLLFTCTGHTGEVASVKVTNDNAFVVTGGWDGKVKIWDAATGALVKTINAATKEVNQVDVSPNNSMLVAATSDKTAKIWGMATGDLLATFGKVDSGVVWTAAWSPLGDRIVTGTAKGDVILWNVATVSGTEEGPRPELSLEISPNPATDWLQISRPEGAEFRSLEIRDVAGKTVLRPAAAAMKLDVSGLANGHYFLHAVDKTGQTASKAFVKVGH